ncbi:MAG: hypothetical protein Q8P02_03675, partial [Candidatus Micrarchaeota archaeon]|nr:hypothetical protein [Candidatus Micrarchaeota archaeon]
METVQQRPAPQDPNATPAPLELPFVVTEGALLSVVLVGWASGSMESVLTAASIQEADSSAGGHSIIYAGVIVPESVTAGTLADADVIILQGSPVCGLKAQAAIAARVRQGAGLIVVGDACTQLTQELGVPGWNQQGAPLGPLVPVTFRGLLSEEKTSGSYRIVAVSDRLFDGLSNTAYAGATFEVLP